MKLPEYYQEPTQSVLFDFQVQGLLGKDPKEMSPEVLEYYQIYEVRDEYPKPEEDLFASPYPMYVKQNGYYAKRPSPDGLQITEARLRAEIFLRTWSKDRMSRLREISGLSEFEFTCLLRLDSVKSRPFASICKQSMETINILDSKLAEIEQATTIQTLRDVVDWLSSQKLEI